MSSSSGMLLMCGISMTWYWSGKNKVEMYCETIEARNVCGGP